MGSSRWSDDAYHSRQAHRQVTNTSAFSYDDQVRESGVAQVHPQMNPYGVIRESRDSDAHPESLAIAVVFDVTGSMGTIPRVLQTKLGALMRTLIQKGYVEHPQILFGAVGDAYCDEVPLQIGQFESGLEMDDDLGKIYIEGGGGGQVYETYELAMYFFAHHTSIDCYEKRGIKGYLFTIGDENPYSVVSKNQIETLIGDKLQADIPIKQAIAKLRERYNYFHIIPTNSYHGSDPAIQKSWKALLGEHVLMLNDESAVSETIALTIGLAEGKIDDLYAGVNDLQQAGYDKSAIDHASNALTHYMATRSVVVKAVKGKIPPARQSVDDGRL